MRRLGTAFLALVVAAVVVPVAAVVAPAPAGAAPSELALEMASGTGVVTLPNIEEPLELLDPTTVSGTLDGGIDGTGEVTGVQLATPDVHFVTEQQGFTVDVDADFTQLGPGSGSIVTQEDGRASVALDVSVRLTLDLDIGGALFQTCVSQPIDLALRSALDAPYDPETDRVTVRDDDFTIPAVPTSDVCSGIVTDVLNPLLAGGGNTITLTLEGVLDLPPAPGEPSVTTLTSAAGTTALGQPATFTASVAPGEGAEATDVPTGEVELFYDGEVSLGRVGLDGSGQAVLATAALPAGSHQVTARYLGDSTYSPSLSTTLAHTVAAVPTITAPVPPFLVAGGAPEEFTATITNPVQGSAQPNLRVDIRFEPLLVSDGLVLEYHDGDSWEPVPFDAGTGVHRYPAPVGFSLAAGASREVRFRMSTPSGARQVQEPVQVRLVTVDPGDGEVAEVLDTKDATTTVVPATRRATSVTLGVPSGAPNPPVGRQGYSVGIRGVIATTSGGPYPSMAGTRAEIYVDGELAPSMERRDFNDRTATSSRVPADFAASTAPVDFFLTRELTRSLSPGVHTVQVRFLGGPFWAPSVSPEGTFTILGQPTPAPYSCLFMAPIGPLSSGARLEVVGDVPAAAAAGDEVAVGRASLRMVLEGNPATAALLTALFSADPDPATGLTVASQNNVGTFTSVTYGGPGVLTNPNLEQVVTFGGLDAAVPVVGAPGEVVDLTLDALGYVAEVGGGLVFEFSCIPVGAAESFGSLTVAGTTVAVDRPAVTVGDAVSLTANVFPSTAQGFVEFLDVVQTVDEETGEVEVVSETSLGVAPLDQGTAALRTRSLPAGDRLVVARHLGDLVQPATTSEPVAVAVRAIECPDFAEAGHGATVRLVYLELLRRCPDEAGFDYWVGRLESGTSAEAFARSISSTPEAVGVVVDDAYGTMLGRAADAPGKAFWVGRMISGSGRYDQLLADLAASEEFWALAGSTNDGFVTRVYDRLLGRAPDEAGLDFWTGRLEDGGSRRSLVLSLANLDEPLGVLVGGSYDQILDRAPSGAERGDGIAFLRDTGDRPGLYAELIGRPEFAARAGTFPN